MTGVIDAVLKLGSASGLVSLVYLVFQNIRKRPRFKFEFLGSSGEHFGKGEHHWYRFSYSGILKNQSLDPNSVTRLHLVVWGNRKKTSYLRFGHGEMTVKDEPTKSDLKLPIAFSSREARHLNIVFEFPVKGTADERLLQEHAEIKPGTGFLQQKHEYEICVEDTGENIFTSDGKQINELPPEIRLPRVM